MSGAFPSTVVQFKTPLTVSAIVPARDEQGSIARVVQDLISLRWPDGRRVVDEVIVVDNGSTDDTPKLARAAGALVVHVPLAGYGRACWHGAQTASGQILLFVDGDGAAVAEEARLLLLPLFEEDDLVVGHRAFPDPLAMSWTQRFGNALACALMRALWGMPDQDLGPFRAIRRTAFRQLDMQDRGFGWTVEMQVRAYQLGLRVGHVPVSWRVRTSGRSKVGGSLSGAVLAGFGILGVIWQVWSRERDGIRRRKRHATPKRIDETSGSGGTRAQE
jgi:glycosyltransferase involved in cell wall biosynthesis